MLILKLVESGQWDLNEPLCHYWVDPDIANDPRHEKLTTRHVLTHQTGFPNWRWDKPSRKLAFDFEPGTQYQYSGEGFEYLRKALENKFNKPLDELLKSVIFAPLGMKNTGYWGKDVNQLNYAHFHDAQGNECELHYPMWVSAADLLFTSIEDYCRFEIDVMNGAGLSPKIYNDMISPHVKIREHYGRGLGWEVINDLPNGEYALEHGGSDPGVKTIAFILPKSKRGIVILTNGDNGIFVYNNVVRESLDTGKILIDYLSNSYSHKAITLPDEILEKYAGTYLILFTYGKKLTIVKENGSLKASGGGFPTVVLFPETEKKFFSKEVDVQFEFEGDSFNIMANGKLLFTVEKIK
jgi:CubicO group peptidase (beta-lactamase class C family)